jgi:DNA polymerase elongation subunit (family B)
VRGLAQRRADTPTWITQAEQEILAELAAEPVTAQLQDHVLAALAITHRYVSDLYAEKVSLEDLVTHKLLSREPDEYRGKSDSAKATRQLRAAGIDVRVGQRIPMVYVVGEKPGVLAWGLPQPPRWSQIDKARYRDLLIRTIHQVLQPLGMGENDLSSLVVGGARQLELWPQEDGWVDDEDDPSQAEDWLGPFLDFS